MPGSFAQQACSALTGSLRGDRRGVAPPDRVRAPHAGHCVAPVHPRGAITTIESNRPAPCGSRERCRSETRTSHASHTQDPCTSLSGSKPLGGTSTAVSWTARPSSVCHWSQDSKIHTSPPPTVGTGSHSASPATHGLNPHAVSCLSASHRFYL
jgi:hypothetical protein